MDQFTGSPALKLMSMIQDAVIDFGILQTSTGIRNFEKGVETFELPLNCIVIELCFQNSMGLQHDLQHVALCYVACGKDTSTRIDKVLEIRA